ncbi:MAG: hypothetical protein JXA41_08230 [Deltaproteobacteria bacterium]|nr:hypothetical protein [Deltaproteobacteria bacterium]
MKKIKSIIGVVIIFLLGTFCGALGAHIVYKTHVNKYISGDALFYREMIVKSLSRKLDLDKGQSVIIDDLVKEAQIEIHNVRKQYLPQIEKILRNNHLKIKAVLRPEQIDKFDQIISRHRAKSVLTP